MKFLLDEDVPIDIARCLKQSNREVFLVAEVLGNRTDDFDVWRHAVETHSILISCNRQDFLKLAGTSPETGLVILNRRRTRQAECQHILELLEKAGESGLVGNINFA